MRLIESIINKGFERKYKIDDTCDECVEESIGNDISDYQKWVDYDMEKYHHISKKTMEEIKKAGLSVVKDQYGEYEVIADRKIEEADTSYNMDESCGKSLKESPVYDMRPQFSGRKSFYGKARVDDDGTTKMLYSYSTPVAKINGGKVTLLPKWNSSQTTLRHVKEFLKQNGFNAENMRQIEKDYPMEEGCAVKECEQGLKEARGGVSNVQIEKIRLSDGTVVQGYGYITSTRTYVYEHVELDVGYKHGEGVYKWMNRPWQRFTYETALRNAAREIGLSDVATEIAKRTSNLEQFIGELAKYIEENGMGKEEPINEAIEDIDIADLANWLKETSEGMAKGDMKDTTISRYGGKSFDPYTICMYWIDGADPDDETLIHSEESPEYVLAVGIKIDNPNEWDGAFLDFPEINGELFDTEMLIVADEDFEAFAREIADDYHAIVGADEE